ncbi:MAG: CatB-related O-acetyltransferase [Oscillospiraceae bacterium]|nr:CatB-related O-acetyltransferase [Oscillospiraceae bacterium]
MISIGDFTYGLPEISLLPSDDTPRVTIGKFCSIAPGVVFLGNCEHHTDWHSTFPFNVFLTEHAGISGHPFGKGDIVVGNDVWIARDARILSGVTIGDGAVIAAGALVTKDVPPYTIAGGVPAKPIKARFSHAITEKLLEMAWWSWPDERIFEAVPLLQSNDFNALHDYYTKKIKDSLRQ